MIRSCPCPYASNHWCLTLRRSREVHSSALATASSNATATTTSFMTSLLPVHQSQRSAHLHGYSGCSQGRSDVEARGGNSCLLVIWPVILHVTRSHKRTKDVVIRCVFESPHAYGGPLGELQRSPSRNGGGVLLLRGGEGRKGGEKGWKGIYLTSGYGPDSLHWLTANDGGSD